jgi:hypothetical protein
METSPHSLLTSSNDQTCLQEDSPVKISARLDCVQDSQAPAVASGSSSGGLFASLDPATSSWKMWARYAIPTSKARKYSQLHWRRFWPTWSLQGMMRNGQVFMPTSSALRTVGSVVSLLPPPMTSDCHHASTTYRRVQSRVDRGHFVGWIGLAVYLRHLSKGYANPRFSEALLGFPLDHNAWRHWAMP